jgi:hypothetical protein
MRCCHWDWLRSDASIVGAALSLFWSVFTVNVGCSELVLYCADADVLNNDHGTGTSLPLELWLTVVSDVLVEELELFIELSDVLLELFSESRAKSTRPEDALIVTSWMVPIRWPEESLTCAPVSLLARTVLSLSRPVALKCFVLQLRLADESLDGWSCDCDCAHADAASIEQAAHTAVIRENFFVILYSFVLLFLVSKEIDTSKRRFETNKPRTTRERLIWGLNLSK